ncbi:MAG: DinB family protein [Bacteroidia bacterium]
MSLTNKELIHELNQKVEDCIIRVNRLLTYEIEALNWREDNASWNVLECIEHLNLYGDFYLPEIEKRISASKRKVVGEQHRFKYSRWGNFFVNAVAPKEEGKINKMNAFKNLNPHFDKLEKNTLDKFLKQQERLLQLLEQAKDLDLNKIKTNSTIKFVRLRLGDTLRAEIYHNQRHINQAYKVIGNLGKARTEA